MPARAFDAAIIGGGMVGMTLACALARAGISVAVVERDAPAARLDPAWDGRASAISLGSARVFQTMGLWPALEPHAGPILDIRVADGHPARGVSPLFLHYDHRDVGEEPFGWIIENRRIRHALDGFARTLPSLTVFAPARVARRRPDESRVTLTLEDGTQLEAAVAVAADGRNSPTRKAAGITCTEWAYDQVSIVCTVAHERDHRGVAVELFMPGGPFAMLPMTEGRSNVVWSDRSETARAMMALDDGDFLRALRDRFGAWLGDIRLAGPRFSHPLGLLHARAYTAPRLALAGDAAHAIHPIAGQGYNMGVRDVAALSEVLVDARRLGLDIGAPSVLRRYETWRRLDNTLLVSVCDGLLRLFSNDSPPLRGARRLGLAAVNRAAPLKKLLMRHAMGVVGDLPRMIRGLPL